MLAPVLQLLTLHDVVKQLSEHRLIGGNNTVTAWKMLRKNDGSRVPFEEMKGARIQSVEVVTDDLMIVHHKLSGYYMAKKSYETFCKTYLPQIVLVNIYKNSVEFLSVNKIDFSYVLNADTNKASMLESYLNESNEDLIAQWCKDIEAEKLLALVGGSRTVVQVKQSIRNFDL